MTQKKILCKISPKKINSFILITVLFLTSNLQLHAQCSQLVWSDEFNKDGAPDPEKWTHETGGWGWGNNESQNYTARIDNSFISDGTLKIKAIKENYDGNSYTSARIATKGKFDFKYGKVEVRAKFPAEVGTWAAIWLLGSNLKQVGWPKCGEIDIAEHLGRDLNNIYGNLHYPERSGKNSDGSNIYITNASTEFHIYAIDWNEDSIQIYVDNQLYYTVTNSDTIPFKHDFYLILNLAMGGGFGGEIDPNYTSSNMEVDYVRVYKEEPSHKILGDLDVFNYETDKYYTIDLIKGATYKWQVPTGATIISGQGTNTINVNWGTLSGNVSVDISLSNCSKTYSSTVKNISEVYEDYQDTHSISFEGSSGIYSPNSSNPKTISMNPSLNVGKYIRNELQEYDAISFTTTMTNAGEFVSGVKQFVMDVYTSAPIGTVIELQLKNNINASGEFPLGRHSIYQATTIKTNAWQTLLFTYDSSPDTTIIDNEVNGMTFFVNPNSKTNDIYYFDNFKSIAKSEGLSAHNPLKNK